MNDESFFVLSRAFVAAGRTWRGSAVSQSYDAAHARLVRLGAHRRIECQLVAASALTAREISRYRAEIGASRTEARAS